MAQYTVSTVSAEPEFDMWFFSELAGETRLSQEVLDELGERWDRWVGHLKAHIIKNEDSGRQFVLLYLEKDVDDEVEGIWQDSPNMGLLFNNLAVCMVMSAAQGFIPELAEEHCAPLPKPGPEMRKVFEEIGVTWKDEGTIDRQFAVFTPYPYSGGCELCFLQDRCPKSRVKQ